MYFSSEDRKNKLKYCKFSPNNLPTFETDYFYLLLLSKHVGNVSCGKTGGPAKPRSGLLWGEEYCWSPPILPECAWDERKKKDESFTFPFPVIIYFMLPFITETLVLSPKHVTNEDIYVTVYSFGTETALLLQSNRTVKQRQNSFVRTATLFLRLKQTEELILPGWPMASLLLSKARHILR